MIIIYKGLYFYLIYYYNELWFICVGFSKLVIVIVRCNFFVIGIKLRYGNYFGYIFGRFVIYFIFFCLLIELKKF